MLLLYSALLLLSNIMVRKAGLEPACLAAQDFESSEYTNFSTFAYMVPRVGLEPTRLSAHAPKACVATITPPGHYLLS